MEVQKCSSRHVHQTVLVITQTMIQSVAAMDLRTFQLVTLDVELSMARLESSAFPTVLVCQVKLLHNILKGKSNFSFLEHVKEAKKGVCDNGSCNTKLHIFVAIFALTVFIHSTSEVGGMLIIMRCTDPKDKAMAMGIVQFSIGLLSNIPCPNIYARIIDATCIVWTKICGRNGHCSLYDSDSFRRYFFGKFLEKGFDFNHWLIFSSRYLMCYHVACLCDGHRRILQVASHRYRPRIAHSEWSRSKKIRRR